jgi:serine phosphatase RsbU (regulator of sigma subunit)
VNRLILFFLLLFAVSVNAQLLRQPVTNFSPRDYGLSYSSYTYCVAEDSSGLIYVGTSYGILQFDGISWRYIPVKAGANVTSLNVVENIVYVGTHNDFGYLKANKSGKYEYKSLLDEFPLDDNKFTAIWKILKWDSKIVFQAEEAVFIYDYESISAIKPMTSYHLAFAINDQLFIRERFIGLLKYDNGDFVDIPDGDLFADNRVLCMLPANQNEILIVTREDGLWLLENKGLSRIELNPNTKLLIDESIIFGGILLDDGNFAIFTLKNGVIILDENYRIKAEYSVNSGLATSEIIDLTQDNYGNLWAATLKGPIRIQYTSPISTFGEAVGLYGSVQAVAKADNKYLVGTSDNLYINDEFGVKTFSEISKVNASVWSIIETQFGWWIAAANGIWIYDNNTIKQVSRIEASSILFVDEKNWIVAAGNRGIQIINAKNGYPIKQIFDVKIEDAYGLAYTFNEKTSELELWIGSRISGVYQVIINSSHEYKHDYFAGMEDGLEDGWVCPFQIGRKIIFATHRGSFRFVSAEELSLVMNDSTISAKNLRGYFDNSFFPKNAEDEAVTAFYYSDSISYAGLGYYVHSVNMNDSLSDSYHFKTLQLGRINVINKKNDNLLIGGDNGLSIFDLSMIKNREYKTPNLLLRRIIIGKDSLIWDGDIHHENKVIVVPYSMNSLIIELSSTYIDNGFGALYSFKNTAKDSEYNRWLAQNIIPIANLREGKYEFVFASKNFRNEIGNEIYLKIQILPPWYRSWWAYTIYVIALILFVYLIIFLNIRRLKAQNKWLEEVVVQRTKEIVEKKEEIEVQRDQIQHQKEEIEHILKDIRSSITYAQRIQSALLPKSEYMASLLDDYFVLFKPKDVVSGDFYWITAVDDWVIAVAADCTGHGVPGAFMSMLGMSFLDQITSKKEFVNTAILVQDLRQAIIMALKQTREEDSQGDGMDLSLIAINQKTLKCHWTGAYNPIWIIRAESIGKPFEEAEEVVEEIRGDKMPVAIHVRLDDFTNHEIQLNKGDKIYMFSDGYVDQFGGPNKRKFNKRVLKKMLAETANLSMNEQHDFLKKTIEDWLNPSEDLVYDQIDDIIVFGIKI